MGTRETGNIYKDRQLQPSRSDRDATAKVYNMHKNELKKTLEQPRKLWKEYNRAILEAQQLDNVPAEVIADILGKYICYLEAWLSVFDLITGAGYIRHADALINRYLNRATWKEYACANQCDRKTYYRHSLEALRELSGRICGNSAEGAERPQKLTEAP